MSSKTDPGFKAEYLRRLPSVGKLMEHPKLIINSYPGALLVKAIREVLDAYKSRILTADDEEQVKDLSFERIVDEISELIAEKSRMSLRRAINATGDILSNNLGRAPMNEAAQKAIQNVAQRYCTLNADGQDDRNSHINELLAILTGAEAGLAVNNNAAAIMLILNTISYGKEVIISRGQLIENDRLRLPDVISKSGARIAPIGTTNKTHLRDYQDAINENTGAILKVHSSNYQISGFSEVVSLQELVTIGKKHKIPVIDDIGTGCLIDLSTEPSAYLSIKNGADIVCFSGDKLISSAQSGIAIGSMRYIMMMKDNPLYRILRVDKLTIAALEATLRLYLYPERIRELNPVLSLMSRNIEEIALMARSLADSLTGKLKDKAVITIEDAFSQMDISAKLPTKLVSIRPTRISPDEIDKKLRSRDLPIFAIIREDRVLIDTRTLWDDELDEVCLALEGCCF